jgi:hypothetical protein
MADSDNGLESLRSNTTGSELASELGCDSYVRRSLNDTEGRYVNIELIEGRVEAYL